MVNGSRKNKVNNPSHPSRTYMASILDLYVQYAWHISPVNKVLIPDNSRVNTL